MKKTVLITGASRGIGRGIAEKLSEEGYKLIINYNKSEVEARELLSKIKGRGNDAIAIKADVSDYEQVKSMFDEIYNKYDRLDILINNAGIAISGLFQDLRPEEWKRINDVNLGGVYNTMNLALPKMLENKSGVILNISSIWGIVGCSTEAAYAATKAGVIALTKSIALECGYSGIRANVIAPGAIATDMLNTLPETSLSELKKETPAGRLGTPNDIAELASFLISDKAEFINGQVISPNGGFLVY